ncbi:MAG: RNA polymerase sigma factor [Planctomycetota bacterium]|jgi:RNA polymerase sigma-70 factor (ECF subfamily)
MSRRERLNDELLVLRCQEADAAAFEELVGRWQERLWRHAWRLTGSEDAAWDVLQEAWIGISRGLGRLQDAAAFPTWAYQIVSNKCRDWIRREHRRRRAAEAYSDQMQNADREVADAQKQSANLKEALAKLPGRDRAILSLRYEEGFDTAEIADVLRIPAGTVKSRLHYARRRLRKYLEE